MMDRWFAAIGAVSGSMSVLLGAFAAHGLRDRLPPDALATFETGARYQLYHAVALWLVAWAVVRWPGTSAAHWAGWAFALGTLFFSGSLYLLAATDVRWLGAVAPVGGALFVLGWLLLAVAALRG